MNTFDYIFKGILKIIILYIGIMNLNGQQSVDPGVDNMTNLGFEAPDITPASPSVAALMRFEEIPVNAYTGMPDINIPLFSTSTLSNKVNLDISLNYHVSSIGAGEVAPFTGLGWSLIAGGSISRTVRGAVDEYNQVGGTAKEMKSGIYSRPSNKDSNNYNYYYEAESWTYDPSEVNYFNRFKWDGYEKGAYDTEHDLYQFNFMGISGRFYLRMNAQRGLDVVRLDDNTQYKIEVDYTGPFFNNHDIFTFHKFTITDPHGIKYIFQDTEKTINSSSATFTEYFDDRSAYSTRNYEDYISAYHLTEIRDELNNQVVKFNYTEVVEKAVTRQRTENTLISHNTIYEWAGSSDPHNQDYDFNISMTEPKTSTTYTFNDYKTKKLSSILINGIGSVDFQYSGGRTDSNLPSNNGARKLDRILVKNNQGSVLKRFDMQYDYFKINGYKPTNIQTAPNYLERLVLTGVKEYGSGASTSLNYELEYHKPFPNETNIFKNIWGYLESNSAGINAKKFTITGALKKMHLPTGGYIQFDFEPSTYSYIGDKQITDFSDNPENTTVPGDSDEFYFNPMELDSYHGSPLILTILDNTAGNFTKFELYLDWQKYPAEGYSLKLKSTNGLSIPLEPTDGVVEVNANNVIYYLEMTNENGPSPGGNPDVSIKVQPYVLAYGPPTVIGGKEFLYGGGVRIREIRFYEHPQANQPTTLKRYEYRNFNDLEENTSSGSIAFSEPKFEFLFKKMTPKKHNGTLSAGLLSYISKTDFDNLSFLKTHGADVGYKYVRILDIDPANPTQTKGKTENTYISPMDYPEFDEDEWDIEDYAISYPFIPSKNFDYRRGQLKHSQIFNENNQKIKEVTNDYEFANESVMTTGLRLAIQNGDGCPYAYEYKWYSSYKARYDACQNGGIGVDCQKLCGFPASHVQIHRIEEAIGWTQLKKTLTKEYFYEGIAPKMVTTEQNYTYNNTNKQVQTQSTTNSLGEVLKKEYKYPQDLLSGYDQSNLMNSLVTKNRISEPVTVKTLNNNIVVAEQQTKYKDFGIGKILPEFVYAKKGTAPFENKITYNRYDAYGNLQQYTLADGTPVSIIWGYNGQYPIAKVEGLAYSAIQAQANALSTNNNLTESSFNALRTLVNSNNAMLSCYLYEPLVGVKMIIQPNGQKETYLYDEFGRLKVIKDHNGNVLKEFEYRYHNQP